MRDITLGDTFRHQFTTRQFSDGVPTVLAGSPVLSVLEGNNITPITSGVSVSVDRASVAGLNEATVVATGGNGYEAAKSYCIYISTGTVGGVSVIGEVVGQFTIAASAAAADLANGTDGLTALKTALDAIPTTAMRGTDNAALASVLGALNDSAAAGDPTTNDTAVQYLKQIVNLLAGSSGIGTMPSAADPANGVNLFEMLRAAMGATFATATDSLEQLQADHVALQSDTDNIQTRIPASLVNSRMDSSIDATGFEDAAVDKIWDETMAGHVTADTSGLVMNEWQDGGRLDLLLDAIPTTAMRGTDNAALASVLGALNDAAAAGDPTTNDTAVQYLKQLVNLLAGTSGIGTMPSAADPANGVNLFEMLRAAMGATFATATDSLEQLQADHVALQSDTDNIQGRLPTSLVNSRMDSTIDATGFEAAAVDLIWDEATSGHVTAGTFGELAHLIIASGTVETSGSNSSTQVQTTLAEASNDHYDVMTILFTSGNEAGQSRLITGYVGVTGVVSWNAALTGTPADSVSFVILSAGTTADAVWDELLTGASHNIATSAGKRLRQLEQAFVQAEGTVVTVTDAHTITLDAGAVATTDYYPHSRLTIVEGTGAGQSRLIIDYTSGRVCTLESDFTTSPDTNSLYTIEAADANVASASGVDLAHGYVATYTNTTTITLDSLAVGTADYYLEMLIVFTNGTGTGQTREITAYTSGRVCTLSPALITALDTTTVYHIQSSVSASHVAEEVWDKDATSHQTGGTFGQAIGDPGANSETMYDAVVTDAAGTNVATDVVAVKAETAAIVDDTDLIDDATSGLAKIATDVAAVLVDTDTTIPALLPSTLVGGRIDATVDGTGMESGAVDAIFQRQMTESYNADGAAPTLEQAMHGILQALTEFAISGTTLTIKKLDGSTTAMTITLDDATNPTSATRSG